MVFCWGWFKEPLLVDFGDDLSLLALPLYHAFTTVLKKSPKMTPASRISMSLDGMSNWQGRGGQLGRVIEVIRKTPSPSPWQIAAHCLQLVEQSLASETNVDTGQKKLLPFGTLWPEAEKHRKTLNGPVSKAFSSGLYPWSWDRFPVNFLFRSSANCGKTCPLWNTEDIYLYIETYNYRQPIAENSLWLHSSWKERKKRKKNIYIYIYTYM